MPDIKILDEAHPFFFAGSETGCLVSHGFTGSTQSMRFLGEYLAEKGGYTVLGPRLAGHGTTVQDMSETTAEDWIRSVEEGLNVLKEKCSKIFITGLSMGGTLTLYMAAMYPELIKGIIPINAAVMGNNPEMASLAFNRDAPATIPGIGSDIKKPGVQELAYKNVPVPVIRHLFSLTSVTRTMLPLITSPALVIQAKEDHVVAPKNAAYIMDRIGSAKKELLMLENSYHVSTLDNDKELIAERTVAFIKENS